MSLLERVFYFHQEVLKNKFPNSTTLAEQFEVSIATAKRDITYLRDRLCAPLAYESVKHGYYYSEEGFRLPFQESPRIIFLLAMLNKLGEEAGLGELDEVKQLEKRLQAMVSEDYEKIIDCLHCQWIEVESINHLVFEVILESIVKNRRILMTYRSIGGGVVERTVAPLKIVNYQGRWYLYGFCFLRNANRLFHIARISGAELAAEKIPEQLRLDPGQIGLSFGIFQGSPLYTAEILFTSTAAELVENQHWHRDQAMQKVEDGLLLRLPVSDDRELLMKILQYGSHARVISPPELVARVREEIAGMTTLYDIPG
jgi:predicted DNA-binding transcriptional regulator YafY